MPSVGDRPPRELSRQSLAEVVEPRYDELFTLVQAELQRSGFENMLAAGVVLTGGTSKMEGVAELAEEIFHAPVRIGAPHNVNGLADIVRNPIYLQAWAFCFTGYSNIRNGLAWSPSVIRKFIWLTESRAGFKEVSEDCLYA